MIGSHLTNDQMQVLVRRFAAINLGLWERPDLMRVIAEQGWSLRDEHAASLAFRTGLPTEVGYASPNPEDAPALRIELASRVDRDQALDVFRTARRLAEDELGEAALRGGSGPWLRWRRPDSTPCLRFVSNADGAGNASVRLELLATERYENRETQDARYLGKQPYSWCRILHGAATDGMFMPGEDTAKDWDDFEDRLGRTIRDVADGATLLGEDPLVLLIEERDDGSRWPGEIPTCFVRLSDGVLRIECPTLPEPEIVQALTGMGWNTPQEVATAAPASAGDEEEGTDRNTPDDADSEGSPDFSRVFPVALPFPESDAREAARLVAGALRSLGATLDALTYWVGRKGVSLGVRLPQLGI
jgi:hypothetical protein